MSATIKARVGDLKGIGAQFQSVDTSDHACEQCGHSWQPKGSALIRRLRFELELRLKTMKTVAESRWLLDGIVARDSSRGPSGDLRSAFTLRSNRLRFARLASFTSLSRNDAVESRPWRGSTAAQLFSRVARCECSRGVSTHGIPAKRFRRVATFEFLNCEVQTTFKVLWMGDDLVNPKPVWSRHWGWCVAGSGSIVATRRAPWAVEYRH
jgi:hypothetical protein